MRDGVGPSCVGLPAGPWATMLDFLVERFPGVPAKALGQKNIPGIAQCLKLEEATVLTAQDIVAAGTEILGVTTGGAGGWSWIAPRWLLG